MVGVVPLLIFLREAGFNTFLDLALNFFNLERGRDDASLASSQI